MLSLPLSLSFLWDFSAPVQSARGERQLNASAGSWRGEKQPGLLRFVFVLCFHPRQLHNPERFIKEPSLLMVSAGILEAVGRRGEGATGLLSARSSSNEVFGAIPCSQHQPWTETRAGGWLLPSRSRWVRTVCCAVSGWAGVNSIAVPGVLSLGFVTQTRLARSLKASPFPCSAHTHTSCGQDAGRGLSQHSWPRDTARHVASPSA